MSPDLETVLCEIGPSSYFGEIGMLYGDYRTATVRAKTYVEVLELKMSSLDDVLQGFPLLQQ